MTAFCPHCKKEHELTDLHEIKSVLIRFADGHNGTIHVYKCEITGKEVDLQY